jgi:hypothetical protein
MNKEIFQSFNLSYEAMEWLPYDCRVELEFDMVNNRNDCLWPEPIS